MASSSTTSSQSDYLRELMAAYSAFSGLSSGNTKGEIAGAAGAAKLGSSLGLFGSSSQGIGQAAGAVGAGLSIYSGIASGTTEGYTKAGLGAAQLAASSGILGSAGSVVGEYASVVGAGLAVYDAVESYQSGKSGSDAMQGASAGAAVGTAIAPGIGTLIGGAIGGIVGGIASAFGPGAMDPENVTWDNYAAAYDKDPKSVQGATPSQTYQSLAGIFDSRGSAIPFYNKYGRMHEGQFLTDMTNTVNTALAQGMISPNDSAQTIYNKVVEPWISSMSPNGWQATNTAKGAPEQQAVGNLLTQMIDQWKNGQNSHWTGVDGSVPKVAAFDAQGSYTVQAQTAAAMFMQPIQAALTSMPGTSNSAMLAVLMASQKGQTHGASQMADPNNPTGLSGQSTATANSTTSSSGSGSDSSSFLSALGGDLSSFLTSPLGSAAEFGTLAATGIAQANSQKSTNDALAASLGGLGTQSSQIGQGIQSQITGGPKLGGALGASIDQQTSAASNLGNIANQYSTGQLTSAQQSQVDTYIKNQRAMVDSQLAASGNTDGSARDAAYQQIDNNAAQLTQQLTSGNLQISEAALTSVQQTYSTLLNQSLSDQQFGFGAQEAAVQTQIQSDTQLSQSLNQLFAGIAQGFGTAMGGGKGTAGSTGSSVAGNLGTGLGNLLKGVSGSASGGGYSDQTTQDLSNQGLDSIDNTVGNTVNQNQQLIDTQNNIDLWQNPDLNSSLDSISNDAYNYDFGNPYGG